MKTAAHTTRVIRLETRYELPFPREAVWPVLSKTDWINRSLGLPAVEYEFAASPQGGSIVTAQPAADWGDALAGVSVRVAGAGVLSGASGF